MFLLLELSGGSMNTVTLIQYGAKFNPLIIQGEWWRFLTPAFLHIGFFHLFMNSVALYFLGNIVERIYGTSRFFFIYFIAAFFGAAASFAFNYQVSAGASGAIYGCFGALLYFGFIHKQLFFRTIGVNLLFILVINLMLSIVVPMVDVGAHLGGLIGGFIASAVVHLPKHTKQLSQVLSFFITIALGIGIVMFGFAQQQQVTTQPKVAAQMANLFIEQGQMEKARQLLDKVIDNQPTEKIPLEVFLLLAFTEIKQGDYTQAIDHLTIVLDKNKGVHEAYYYLSVAYFNLGDIEQAKEAIKKAVNADPKNPEYEKLYNQLIDQD